MNDCERSLNYYRGKMVYSEEKTFPLPRVYHKFHMHWVGFESGPLRWETSNWWPEPRHDPRRNKQIEKHRILLVVLREYRHFELLPKDTK